MVQMIFDPRNYVCSTLKREENGKLSGFGVPSEIAQWTTNLLDWVPLEDFVKELEKFIADILYILKKVQA
jgi:hypothetical protein